MPKFITMTNLLYIQSTDQVTCNTHIRGVNSDENGNAFIILDDTNFYPQGGGQPSDKGILTIGGKTSVIKKAAFTPGGEVRHYVDTITAASLKKGQQVSITIDSEARFKHSVYHTLGHLLVQILIEDLGLNVQPLKAHHFPGEAYVEVKGASNEALNDAIKMIHQVLCDCRKAHLSVSSAIYSSLCQVPSNAMLPSNFRPLEGKPLRLVTIQGYKPIPCGGTHVNSLSQFRGLSLLEVKKKSGKYRIRYECVV